MFSLFKNKKKEAINLALSNLGYIKQGLVPDNTTVYNEYHKKPTQVEFFRSHYNLYLGMWRKYYAFDNPLFQYVTDEEEQKITNTSFTSHFVFKLTFLADQNFRKAVRDESTLVEVCAAIKADLHNFYSTSTNEVFNDGFVESTLTIHQFALEMALWKRKWDYMEGIMEQGGRR